MKKIKYLFTILIAAILVGCANDIQGSSEEKNYFDYSNQNFSVSNVSKENIDDRTTYTFNYNTIDQNGQQITCSSFLEYPKTSSTKQVIDIVVINCHGTIFSDDQAPSKIKSTDFGNSTLITEKNVLVISPDYIGYGASNKDSNNQYIDHPYMIADINARTIIDAALCALKNPSEFKFELKSNYNTVICGFSQGGQTSLATFKAIQDKIPTEYENLLNVQKCYCGAGPYDLIATMDVYLNDWEDAISPLIYLVVKGMLSAEYDCLKNYTLEDFFTTDFLTSKIKTKIDEKNIKMSDITSNTTLLLEYMTFRDKTKLLTNKALQSTSTEHKALKKALTLNNISTGWTVKKNLYIYHHQQDDMVPFENYTKIMQGVGNSPFVTSLADSATINVSTGEFLHGKSAGTFYYIIRQELNN